MLQTHVTVGSLSSGTRVYARSQRGERPSFIKDLVRLEPSTVQLWNGQEWAQVIDWGHLSLLGSRGIEIELRSGERLRCTPTQIWPTVQRGAVLAECLALGDVLERSILPEPVLLMRPSGLDDHLIGWFVGLYIAEGSRSEDTLLIASHVKEVERVEKLKNLSTAYHGTCAAHHTHDNAMSIHLNGNILGAIIDTYVSGNTAKGKHLKPICWERSNEFLSAILDGYLSGDGHFDGENNRWRLGFTENRDLANDLRTLCARLNIGLRLRPGNARLYERRFPMLRGEIRFIQSQHYNRKFDSEVVEIGECWGKDYCYIAIMGETGIFSLASGILAFSSAPEYQT